MRYVLSAIKFSGEQIGIWLTCTNLDTKERNYRWCAQVLSDRIYNRQYFGSYSEAEYWLKENGYL